MESYSQWWSQLRANRGERYAFKRIKSDAAPLRREFTISLEWFIDQCHRPCNYCGRVDRNNLSVRSRGKSAGWLVKDFKYNGLDRLDNSKGYTEENCVPCCAICNRAKNSMGYNEFIEYLTDLVNFRTPGDRNEQPIHNLHLYPQWNGGKAGNTLSVEVRANNYVLTDGASRGPFYTYWYLSWDGTTYLPFLGFKSMDEEEPDKEN